MMAILTRVLGAGLVALCVGGAAAQHGVAAPVYGFGAIQNPQNLYQINPKTGKKTVIGSPIQKELSGQQLSSIDAKQKVYYLLDFNETSRKPNLLGLSLLSGELVVDIEIELPESMFVGVGQYLAADPLTHCVVIAGMDPTVKGYRVFQVCPYSSVPSKAIPIGTITAPAVGLLGSCSAIDHTRGLFYATMPLPPSGAGNVSDSGWSVPGAPLHTARLHVNGTVESQLRTSEHHQQHVASGSAPPPPPPPMPKFEIDLMTVYYKGPKKGQMHRIKMSEANSISTCAFDSVAKKVVGFGVMQMPSGGYEKTLRSAPVPPGSTFETIGALGPVWQGEMGPITTVDSASRTHYSLLQKASKAWVPSTGCAATGFPCKAPSLCCHDPPTAPACFSVPNCAALSQPNMTFFLVPISLDTAKPKSDNPPYMCSITDGPGCPWSIEVAGSV